MSLGSWLFGSDESQSTNTTSSTNISDTSSKVDSHNVANNTSYNSTVNDTNTLTQDRRLVIDHGLGITADNSSLWTIDSGNSYQTTNDTTNYTTTDFGAVQAVVASNTSIAGKAIDVSTALARSGQEMMAANLSFLQHVSDNSQSAARSAISEVATATGNALNQVAAIAAKPLNANDPQRLVIIVALGVLGVVFFSKMKA